MAGCHRLFPCFLGSTFALILAAPVHPHGLASRETLDADRAIVFPDTADHLTLVVDLHTHSVFSDGHVWPRIRVAEALRDGLDAIAITEHLEWQPHLADIPHPDRNRAHAEAVSAAGESDLIVINGSEITRNAPAGHMNAIFISDANELYQPLEANPADPREYYLAAGQWPAQEAVEAANAQGAFVFWNHPYFGTQTPDGIARMNDFHRANARRRLLHGIEIANGQDYSEEAFAIALDHGLTLLGVSDVHELIDWDYAPHTGGHRPVNLVFTTERTADAIRTALFEQRTVVWFRNLLMGRPEHLMPLLDASLTIESAAYTRPDSDVLTVRVVNRSDAAFLLKNLARYTFMHNGDLIEIPPHESVDLLAKPGKRVDELPMKFEVMNALVAPKRHPTIARTARVVRPNPGE